MPSFQKDHPGATVQISGDQFEQLVSLLSDIKQGIDKLNGGVAELNARAAVPPDEPPESAPADEIVD